MKKIYLLLSAVLFAALVNAQDKKVMVVSSAIPSADAIINNFVTNVDALPGITATHVPLTDMMAMTDFSAYDAAILTENGGSSDMAAFGSAGWPLPAVHLKFYAVYKGTFPIVTDANFMSGTKQTDLLPGVTDLKIKDASDIFKCYKVDSVITWTEGYNTSIGVGAGEAHLQVIDLKDAALTDAAVSPAATLLGETMADDASLTKKTFLWKVDENTTTKRLVLWGVHHEFLEHATDDFWTIIQNSVLWVLGKEAEISCGVTGFKELETSRIQVYPNPVVSNLNINSAELIQSISILDITGKTIIEVNNVNSQNTKINLNNLYKGIYIVHVQTLNGESFTGKVTK
ncbi:MAG: T9SS type A sorting domain-containing protein [Bacteroidales bacterium]|nr:T9SS type A sorting domain-containing protein [Bacteroidales bacterium]